MIDNKQPPHIMAVISNQSFTAPQSTIVLRILPPFADVIELREHCRKARYVLLRMYTAHSYVEYP